MYGIRKADVTLQSQSLRKPHFIYIMAALLSILFSYLGATRAAVINPDAICYIQSAASMKLGLTTAMQVCGQAKWPFYSMLIYGIAEITHLSYVSSAYLLDTIFSLITVLSFIFIVSFIQHSTRLLWLAAFVILFSHEFNAVREYIVRDHGFWAFYLVSMICLLHYFKSYQLRYALGWGMSLLVATLFRVEGFIFLIMIPFAVLFIKIYSPQLAAASLATGVVHADSCSMDNLIIAKSPVGNRLLAFFQLNAVLLMVALILGIGILLYGYSESSHHLGRLDEIYYQLTHGISESVQRFHAHADILGNQILSQYASHDAKQVLILMLAIWFFANVVSNVSLIYAGLVLYAWTRQCLVTSRSNKVILWSYLVINCLITFAFLVENMFLSKRYLLALSLTLMIWVPFSLNKLTELWLKRRTLVVSLFMLIIIFSLGGLFDFGYSKRYIRDAGEWLAQNVPANAELYGDDEQLLYYSNHFGNDLFVKSKAFSNINIIADGTWKHYDYIALRTSKKELSSAMVEREVLGQPVQEFANKRGDKVSIYKIH